MWTIEEGGGGTYSYIDDGAKLDVFLWVIVSVSVVLLVYADVCVVLIVLVLVLALLRLADPRITDDKFRDGLFFDVKIVEKVVGRRCEGLS